MQTFIHSEHPHPEFPENTNGSEFSDTSLIPIGKKAILTIIHDSRKVTETVVPGEMK